LGKRAHEAFPFTRKALSDDEVVPGLLEIGNKGGNGTTYLVGKGIAYGTIWDGYDDGQLIPTGLTFSKWYEQWAQKTILSINRESIADTVKVGMKVSEVIKICGANGKRPDRVTDWILRFDGITTAFELDRNRGDTVIRIIWSLP